MAGEEESGIIGGDSFQRYNKLFNIGTMMGVDGPDAAILVNVVPAEEQIACAESQLANGMAWRVPDCKLVAAYHQ